MSNNLNIWKASQSPKFFSKNENDELFDRRCICVHPDTSAKGKSSVSQGEDFCNVKKGDFFYLCYGNSCIRLFGMFTGESQPSLLLGKEDWLEQKYILYFESISEQKYHGPTSWWTPNDNSTFTRVNDIDSFEKWILIPFFQKTLNEIEIIGNMKTYEKLLLNNHNLILTGAPGTGKTYLAKQIARQIVSKTEKEKPINVLKEAIEKYISDDEEEQKRKNLLANFLNIYPKEKLQDMSLEDYCIGNSDVNNNNFCYWMERKLEPLGRYFPGSSKSYMVYWNKTDEEYKVHGYLKTMSDKPEVVMKTLAKDISNMVIKDDPMSMAKKIGESFILKILSVYYPFEYAPINSRVHIDNIISLFGIQCESDKVFERNKAIYRFYEEQTQEKKISPWAFMSILYHNFNIKDGEVIQDGVIKKEGDFCIVQFHPILMMWQWV